MWLQAVARGGVLLARGLAAVADGVARCRPAPAPAFRDKAAPRPCARVPFSISRAVVPRGRTVPGTGPHARARCLFPSSPRLQARPPDPHRPADASGARAVSLCPSFPRRVSFS